VASLLASIRSCENEPGRDDVIILLVGEAEKAAILSESRIYSPIFALSELSVYDRCTRAQMPNN